MVFRRHQGGDGLHDPVCIRLQGFPACCPFSLHTGKAKWLSDAHLNPGPVKMQSTVEKIIGCPHNTHGHNRDMGFIDNIRHTRQSPAHTQLMRPTAFGSQEQGSARLQNSDHAFQGLPVEFTPVDLDAMIQPDQDTLPGTVPNFDSPGSFGWNRPEGKQEGWLEEGYMVDGNQVPPSFRYIFQANDTYITQNVKNQAENRPENLAKCPVEERY